MYLVPLIVLVAISLIATAWTPIFGLIIFVVGFALFLAYVGLGRRANREADPPSPQPGAEISAASDDEVEGGLWGERNPDKDGALRGEGS